MENNFDSAKWIREFKTALFEEKEKKEKAKKADKVDMKIGAENDLAIEKDKDGHDVYARGLKEAFEPGNMWSDDFDYNGMLRYSVNMEIPEDPNALQGMLETLKNLYESYTDVNYHSEAQDLGNAIDYIEDSMTFGLIDDEILEDLENAQKFLESHKIAAAKTLKELTKGKM